MESESNKETSSDKYSRVDLLVQSSKNELILDSALEVFSDKKWKKAPHFNKFSASPKPLKEVELA